MRERREYRQFARRQLLTNASLTLIGAVAFYGIYDDFKVGGLRFQMAAGVFVLAVVLMALLEFIRWRRFRCPSCNHQLPKPHFGQIKPGDPICFVCEECNVEWDSLLSVSRE